MLYHPFPIIIALGSNLDPTRQTFERSCALLERRGIRMIRRSRLYWTRPWGVTDQPPFMNAAVAVHTRWTPREILRLCLDVENQLGRRRLRPWGPRRIDLDLLLYGGLRLQTAELTLPHPRIAQRDFVLAPLIDLGVPPSPAIAPRGWEFLLRELPAHERTIIHSESWRT